MRLSPDIRGAFRVLAKTNLTVTSIAETFKTTRQTVYRWLKRGQHRGLETFKDKPREPKESKVTFEVELSTLKLRTTFKWGTARIQQGLYNLSSFILESVLYSRRSALQRNHKQRPCKEQSKRLPA